jgi:nucleotide-binding universal stress UspA family protein
MAVAPRIGGCARFPPPGCQSSVKGQTAVADGRDVPPARPFRRILLAVDGAPAASNACLRTAAFARLSGAAVTILHVARPASPRNPMSRGEALRAAARAEAEGRSLLVAAREVVEPYAPCQVELHTGTPAEVICRRAREIAADLVVVGSRNLGALDRLLLGSVSAAVAQQAPCPVLIVREKETAGA